MKTNFLKLLTILVALPFFLTSCMDLDETLFNELPPQVVPPVQNPCIGAPASTTDPGVIINGVKWATRNVGCPGTFTTNPEDAGMFYQWNRNVGWSSTNPLVSSNSDTIWDSSTPSGTSWYAENCPCPPGWRVPTQQELQSLNNSGSTWVTNWNGTSINGRVFGTYPNQIFLPAAGWRDGDYGFLGIVGTTRGFYWSNTQFDNYHAWDLWFHSGSSGMNSSSSSYFWWWSRTFGFSVRCVAITE